MKARILTADDREGIRSFIEQALRTQGYTVCTAVDGLDALEKLKKKGPFDLLITDVKMPRMDGIALLEKAREAFPHLPVVVLTAHGTIGSAVQAMKMGAVDYLSKPLDSPGQLRAVVANALAHSRVSAPPEGSPMVAVSGQMNRIREIIGKVAKTDATVLLTGDSGTGKEVAARELHRLSTRKNEPFVAVNCAAISPQLIESEIFGHEKGAFTGATDTRQGRFEAAHGGTLFLDEVGELPLALQAKLLRVLQEQTFERVGGTAPIQVDVRIIAATNRDLRAGMADGTFREDLFHRLSVFPIHLPSLADRADDILPLAEHFLTGLRHRMEKPFALDDSARKKLLSHPWPGNIRELGNVLERAVILCDGAHIGGADLHFSDDTSPSKSPAGPTDLKTLERQAIQRALAQTDGHRKKAAELLGIGLRTLYNKLKEYGLD